MSCIIIGLICLPKRLTSHGLYHNAGLILLLEYTLQLVEGVITVGFNVLTHRNHCTYILLCTNHFLCTNYIIELIHLSIYKYIYL